MQRNHGVASCKGAASAARFPCPVKCYGRTYLTHNADELAELLGYLHQKNLRLANRFRVGGSWPRGKQAILRRDGPLWRCGDCLNRHRWWTLRCPVSLRTRAEAQLPVAVDPVGERGTEGDTRDEPS